MIIGYTDCLVIMDEEISNIANPKVSVVIPIFNAEKYLDRCLASVAAQTDPDFEVFMIDDASTDNSAVIAKKYLSDNRFHYILQQKGGVSAARNKGLEMASGKWIAFIDSDDKVAANYLQRLLAQTDDSIDIVSSGAKYIDASGFWQPIHFYDGNYVFVDSEGTDVDPADKVNDTEGITPVAVSADPEFLIADKRELYLELINSRWRAKKPRRTAIGVPWGKLYRRSFLANYNFAFHTGLKRLQDNIFNMFAFEKARAIKYVNEPLYVYNLEHITGFGDRYEPEAPYFYDLVLQIRRDFLLSRRLMEDKDIRREYCREVLNTSHTMLKSFYLNRKNPMSDKEKTNALEHKFTGDLYRDAFHEPRVLVQGKGRNIRLFLLKREDYQALLVADKAIYAFKTVFGSKQDIPVEISSGGGFID